MIGGVVFDALKSLVSNRCYPNTFPQPPKVPIWPAIRYTVISQEPVPDICGTDVGDTDDTRVQIDCVAASYGDAYALRQSVIAAMQLVAPPCLRDGGFETYDSETKTHRMSVDYLFHPSST